MKKKIIFFILLVVLVIANSIYAYTVDGYAYLQNQSNHSGIEVEFVRTAPDSWAGSTTTSSNGYFSINVDLGAYDITCSKDGYFYETVTGKLINSNTTLNDVTLIEHTFTINVPALFSTIQEAINRSTNGDTVLVAPGTYFENINFNGKNITVTSLFHTTKDRNYIFSTIIDANNNGIVVTFVQNENSNAVLKGFTIRNGHTGTGAGIYCEHSSPTLTDLIITGNIATHNAGGMHISVSNASLTNVIISGNSASDDGGGIRTYLSNSILTNVIISNNCAGRDGGGILCWQSNLTITNSILSDNDGNCGIYVYSGASPTINYSNFWNNEGGNFYGCDPWLGVNATKNSNGNDCDMYNNIQLDPIFIGGDQYDYYLSENSPCIDAGNPADEVPENGGLCIDIGAYEYTGNSVVRAISGTNSAFFGKSKVKLNVTTDNCDSIRVTHHDGNHPSAPNSVSHYATIDIIGGTATADATFYYENSELNGQNESNLNIWKYNNGLWTMFEPSSFNTNENWVKVSEVSSFSDFILSDAESDVSLPVTISFFNACQENNYVILEWCTESETENLGFIIDRREDRRKWLKIASYQYNEELQGTGSKSSATEYKFIDKNVIPGMTYEYRLSDVSYDGEVERHGILKITITNEKFDVIAESYQLYEAYPNPFNPITTITYQIAEPSFVRLSVYNINGRLVQTLVSDHRNAGYYSVKWDASNVSSGIYIYRIDADNFSSFKKCLMVK